MANTIRHKRGTTEPTAGVLVTGELAINTGDGNVYTKLDDGTVTNIVAKSQKLTSTVRNETGSTIASFKAVYISGASANKALVTLAQANSESTSSKTFGVTMASISTNNNGEVICVGLLEKVDTSAYTAGTQLWLSPTSAGGFVTTAPTAPNHSVFIGTVTYSHANNGKVEIRIQNGYELAELHNVSITSVANKDIISYNSSTGLYENRTATALGLAPLASPTFTGTVTIPAGASISGFAPLASPALTGTPTAPTASSATNTTQIATTAYVKAQAYATLASPTFTGTPSAPTASTATNTTQVATTAYVKSNLASYAPLASPTLTGSPQAPTQSTGLDSNAIATTAFVKKNIRRPVSTFSGSFTNMGAFEENVAYHSTGDAQHLITLWYSGYFNVNGSVIMFKQSDNTQMDFNDGTGYTKPPNGNRWYAAFPNAVVFAVKNDVNDWFIFGDLISTQYPAYGTLISGPTIDTTNTVYSGYTDYYGNNVYAYTAYNTVENGWGGTTTVSTNATTGTVMSGDFTYSSGDTYNLLADGSGGYTLNFVSSGGGGGYDPYGTKVGTPYWDNSYNALYQTIADGNGGTTSIAWDGFAPYPAYGVQVSTTSFNNADYKNDAIGTSYYVYYDSTYYADGNGGSYEGWTITSGSYYPSGWAFTNYAFNTGVPNTSYYYYDEYGNTVYPWTWGYNSADGMGNTYFNAMGTPPNGEPASDYFTDNSYIYGRIYADGTNGFYFAS